MNWWRMSQQSFTYTSVEQRRRRRFRVSSRAYLSIAVTVVEGALACAVMLLINWKVSGGSWDPEGAMAAILLGATHAWLAAKPTQRFIAFPVTWHMQAWQILFTWSAVFAINHLAALTFGSPLSTAETVLWWGLSGAAILATRSFLYGSIALMFADGRFQIERVGLVGSQESIREFQQQANIWQLGCQVVARHTIRNTGGTAAELSEFASRCVERRCDHVLVVGELSDVQQSSFVVDACREYALNVGFAPFSKKGQTLYKFFDVLPLGPANTVSMLRRPLDDRDQLIKRLFDLFVAVVALFLLSPLLVLTAVLVRVSSAGPVFFRQERRGFNGRPFYIYKFRSMSVTEDGRAMNPAVPRDPRITPLGRFLRRTSIDELPQLLNVIRGEMSLVGPRPHALSHDDDLSRRYASYARRRRIKPGITGWAQVNGCRGDVSTQEKIEDRTRFDLEYIENWSLDLDVWILFLTLFSRTAHKAAE
jgi:Undecaprenyl-phosphate glucose phosphotransferase